MTRYTINNEELYNYNDITIPTFPRYTTQLMNLISHTAQATRPRVVGQLTDLFREYANCNNSISIEGWKNWYQANRPNAVNDAVRMILLKKQEYLNALNLINETMIRQWVEDLIYNKTYNGLYVQDAIIKFLADKYNTTDFRFSNPEEESRGIDAFIQERAYSVKPMTYRQEGDRLNEEIDALMIYYEKNIRGLDIEVEDDEDRT